MLSPTPGSRPARQPPAGTADLRGAEGRARLPDFLCIGAQKCGTSWLHEALSADSRIWMPPIKEIHFFGRTGGGWGSLLGGGALGRERRRLFQAHLLGTLRRRDAAGLFWNLRFFLGRRDLDWYARLFAPAGLRLAGEVSPSYSTLSGPEVAAVRDVLPDARILLLLRDPVERDWSQALQDLVRRPGRTPESVRLDEYRAFLDELRCRERSDYLGMLDRWETAFGPDRVFVGFLDDVAEDPQALLARIRRFVGLAEPASGHTVPAAANPGGGVSLPPEIGRWLSERHQPALRQLAARFDGPPRRWLERASARLAERSLEMEAS